jgi:hypothetical protein
MGLKNYLSFVTYQYCPHSDLQDGGPTQNPGAWKRSGEKGPFEAYTTVQLETSEAVQ